MHDTLIEFGVQHGVRVVTVGGEVDATNAETFGRYLEEAVAGTSPVIVSFLECQAIDACGLQPVARLMHRLLGAGAVVALPQSAVRRTLDLAQMPGVCDSLELALARVGAGKMVA